MSTFVLPLSDPNATLEAVGGKGMSLAKMARAGLPVPGGFHVTTEAYRQFVAENGIQAKILDALQGVDAADPARLEIISQQIGKYFSDGVVSPEIIEAITTAYAALPKKAAMEAGLPVAVRSSATAEDLPGASFAGQQETYLNICGTAVVLAAIKKCWASLWTARAIAYRARQGIATDVIALAVVVQELVFADAAGILFTANPINGKRNEIMITATWGLGEAIVGGLVTPDTITMDKTTGKLLRRETSAKQVMTVRIESGTREQAVPDRLKKRPVLTGVQASDLARLGQEIEKLYAIPMDVEWTLAGGKFAIVQARPITSLPEPPLEWVRTNPKALLARASFAEFVPDPISPLFATLAVPIVEAASRKMMLGYMGVDDPEGYLFDVINGYIYIGMVLKPKMIGKMLITSIGQAKKALQTGLARWAGVRAKSRELAGKWNQDLSALPAPELLAGVRELVAATADYYTVAQSGPIPAALSSEVVFGRFYHALVKRKQDPAVPTFLLGFESVPMRAEKSLYDLSMWAKDQPELSNYILHTPTTEICAALNANPIPAPLSGPFSTRFAAHLAEFGHTIYDLDFAKPVPADDPAPVLDAMKAYLDGKGASPHERQRAQAERREQAEQSINQRLDPLRRKWFTKLLKWAQSSAPDRENCIADLGLGYPQMRKLLHELGRRLAAGGAVAQPQDVYWLETQEADDLAAALERGEVLQDYSDQVEDRKARWQRARGTTPPLTLPEKSFMAKLIAHDNPEGNTLKGYGASAGKVIAPACVLRGPDEFGNMRPGDVIVAVTTTPAWTPLFAMASAVVTDIGGPLSHSSIVAREYGIPAVMATGTASKRVKHGQMITVDGSAGIVTLLGNEPGA
jgi:phosphoenolpyruvate synthase/pyruvate phosphate dikinase